jgi:hypothetical protein
MYKIVGANALVMHCALECEIGKIRLLPPSSFFFFFSPLVGGTLNWWWWWWWAAWAFRVTTGRSNNSHFRAVAGNSWWWAVVAEGSMGQASGSDRARVSTEEEKKRAPHTISIGFERPTVEHHALKPSFLGRSDLAHRKEQVFLCAFFVKKYT